MMWILCFTYTMFCVLLAQSFVFIYTKFCVLFTQSFVFMPCKKAHKTANTLSNCEKIFAKVQNTHRTNACFAK